MNIIPQLYKPKLKIAKRIYFYRVLAKIIIKIFLLDKLTFFSNIFQQLLQTTIKINLNGKKLIFKDGNERLFLFYKTQFIVEKDLVNWIFTFKKKDIFYDIGSNIGMFSILSAKRDISTYAFECLSANLNTLNYNILLNNCNKNITIIPNPLNANEKKIIFRQRDLTASAAKNCIINNTKKSLSKLEYYTLSFSLDKICEIFKLPPPNKLKIDVDGLELEILKGSKKALTYCDEVMIEMYERKVDLIKCYNENYLLKKINTRKMNSNYHEHLQKKHAHKKFYDILKFMESLGFKKKSEYGNNILFLRSNKKYIMRAKKL